MCGLVGLYSSNFFMKHREMLETLLYLDTFRGKDSTGVAAIRHNADTSIIKSTVPGYEFIEGGRLDRHCKLNDFLWIGHNRYGTVGKNIKTNAHPFQILDEQGSCIVVGAHNGTLKNKHVLKDHANFGTDTEALYNNIAEEGLEATLPKIEGAWALTYYDHKEEELRIIRNSERTLFYAYEEGHKTLIWASEMWMIRVAASRHNVKLEDDKVYSFAEDTLYKFPAPDKMNDVLTVERQGGLVGKQPAFFQNNYGTNYGGHHGGQQLAQTPQQKAATAARKAAEAAKQGTPLATSIQITPSSVVVPNSGVTQQKKNESSSELPLNVRSVKANNVLSINAARSYKGFEGEALSLVELQKQLDGGCGWCELEFIGVNDKYGWLAKEKPLCEKCLHGIEDVRKAHVSVH